MKGERKKGLLFVGGDEELDGIEEVLPNDISRCTQRRQGVKEGIRHPDAEGGVLLSESLTGCDGRDTRHRLGSGRRVNEDILIVRPFAWSRQVIADQLAETELQQADKEGTY